MKSYQVVLIHDGKPAPEGWQAVEAENAREAAEKLHGYSLYAFGAAEHLKAMVRRPDNPEPALFYEMPENA